jgi:hypothetical protein
MMNIEELEKRIKDLEEQVRVTKDIEEIERLQKAYGYYIEHWMPEELTDLFADGPDVAIHLIGLGIYQGKDRVRQFFNNDMGNDPEFIHQVMQTSGIVTVAPDGQTAKGRWNGWGVLAIPMGGGVKQEFLGGMYENDYVKQEGVWKIKVARHFPTYYSTPREGIVKPEREAVIDPNYVHKEPIEPDIPDSIKVVYPSGYILPFHFKHPVTGKETNERQKNTAKGMENINL